MKSYLETKSLDEVCIKITDGSHFSPQAVESDFMMASSKDMTDHGWDYSDIKRISRDDYDKLVKSDCKPKLNDVLIIKDGNSYLQRVFTIKKEEQIVILSSIAILRPDPRKIDPFYLQYLLKTAYIKEAASNFVTGAAIPRVILSDFKKIQIPYPPLHVQQGIASILCSYDELIEVNNKRIRLLEETAQQLYKEWFVRMRFPGHATAKFIKGIPDEWEIITVDEAFTTTGGGTPDTTNESYWNGEINWYSPTDITASQTFILSESRDKITEKGLKESSAKLFPPRCVMMTSRATIAAVGINTTPACTNQGFITCIPNEQFPCEYLYFWILSNKEYFEMLASGATFLEISRTTFRKVKIIKPEMNVIAKYRSVVEPIFKQIENLQNQNISLRQIRERLLPRLINGKLQVNVKVENKLTPISPLLSSTATEENHAYHSNVFFTRRVLAAYIIDRLHNEITFGHVKLMKLMYLCEHLAEIETASHYHRDAAGPYDSNMIRSIDSQLKKGKWFEAKLENGKYNYYPLAKKDEYKSWFDKYFLEKQTGIDSLINLFGKEKTEKVEMVATLYEAHRDLKSKKRVVTEKEVIHEVLNNWHESKKRIDEGRWKECLAWMQQKNWINMN
jgi:type I restriction enzyme, S subunit